LIEFKEQRQPRGKTGKITSPMSDNDNGDGGDDDDGDDGAVLQLFFPALGKAQIIRVIKGRADMTRVPLT